MTPAEAEVFDHHVQQKQHPVVRVKDGFVFTFTVETLTQMLTIAADAGQVVVFVPDKGSLQ